MADAYWRYSDPRQPPLPPSSMSSLIGKRSRSDYDVASGCEISSYYPRDGERETVAGIRDTDTLNASYDRYLCSAQIPSYTTGQSTMSMSGGLASRSVDDPRIVGVNRGTMGKDRPVVLGGERPEVALPPDASSTLFVEGLPANCTRREVAHIFRPFVGYKEVRLVSKEPRHHGGDPLVLCFVDFVSPAHAATAMDALQGYKFDELDRNSVNLRLQFARFPGARSGGGHRGKR